MKVRVGFDVDDARILPEMGARVAFLEQRRPEATKGPAHERALVVPEEAVQVEGDTGVVFVVADGRVERRAVRIGAASAGGRLVLSGITAGTRVALGGGAAQLADGTAVRIVE